MALAKEQRAFATVKESSLGRLNMKRIENSITAGMPDVILINRKGTVVWLELKALDEWPKRATTAPLKGKFEKGQLAFMREWRSWKGHSFCLLRVGTVYYLLDPRSQLDELSTQQLTEMAVVGKDAVIGHLEDL